VADTDVPASTIDAINFDCADPRLLADFWGAALGYELWPTSTKESAAIRDPDGKGHVLLFFVVPEGKAVKNRIHLDLTPPGTMREEVERLRGLGASVERLVEEGDSRWTIMLDPEGNEFCVLRGDIERGGS
jgi:hypothetical protein